MMTAYHWKRCQVLRYITVFFLLVLTSLICNSEDYNPPAWRSQTDSSFQLWRFNFLGSDARQNECSEFNSNTTPWGQSSTPDKLDNPYQEITGICAEYQTPWMISGQMDWLREYNFRDGVWMLKGDTRLPVFMSFMVPNADRARESSTDVHVQIVSEDNGTEPEVILRYPATNSNQAFIEIPASEKGNSVSLPLGWNVQVFKFEIPFCPLYQIVQIKPPPGSKATYIDEVAIDSICKNNQ
jgi:hypothetical protein